MPPRTQHNKLNDLSNREWIKETKSFWRSQAQVGSPWTDADLDALTGWLCDRHGEDLAAEMLTQTIPSTMLSQAPPRGKLKSLHPATFSERDIERLIRFFTKEGERVLDPFLGSGSTLLAANACGRHGLGIELIEQWAEIARQRLAEAAPIVGGASSPDLSIIQGDAREQLATLEPDSLDFIVTSPPYWSILEKKGMKVQAERQSRDLPTKYSDQAADLGNITSYDDFLDELAHVFAGCQRVLKPKRYLAVIVSDFRHGSQFVLFHADLAKRIEQIGLPLRGITILLQDNKNLYPFGVPNAFVSNVHHQYILIHQKPA
ncbi:MAG: TRM11 family SAM-dependent methyltransferase [Armatimonadota bacterium]